MISLWLDWFPATVICSIVLVLTCSALDGKFVLSTLTVWVKFFVSLILFNLLGSVVVVATH